MSAHVEVAMASVPVITLFAEAAPKRERVAAELRRERGETSLEMRFYRDRTASIVRRYFRSSVELGRLPAALGKQFFRGRVSHYKMRSFEDACIFVHDVESCMKVLSVFEQQVIVRVIFQEYTQREAAGLLDCSERTVRQVYGEALDSLSEVMLRRKILQEL